jgi:hypothetical protein
VWCRSYRALGFWLLAGLTWVASACSHSEEVFPFIDAGDPCSASMPHAFDCQQFPDQTCVVEGASCPREIYGCSDASYFTSQDYSQCPAEGGADVALLGDGNVLGNDGPADSSSEADAGAGD